MLDILIVDDEPAVRLSVGKALTDAGHQVTEAEDGAEALELILSRVFDVAVFDVRLPSVDGLTLFRRLHLEAPGTVVILMTAFAHVPDAVDALRGGAHDYVVKPFDPDDFAARVIGPVAERHALRQQFERARARLSARDMGAELVGSSPFAARLRAEIDPAAQSRAPLLIRGERGTGKRLVARLVHDRGPRRSLPYVGVSCAALARDTMEGDLFGYAAGGFVGAPGADQGYFKAAQGGTLVLADIGAMPMTCQARVATALRDEAVVPLGSYAPSPVDVRVIATSEEDLEARVAAGEFREDLLCKLKVLEIHVVPLRDRNVDLPLLFEYFSRRLAQGTAPRIAPPAWEVLCSYPFPGNVDELEGAVKHALALARGNVIDVEHLPAAMIPAGARHPSPSGTRMKVDAPSADAPRSRPTPQAAPPSRRGSR
jgi:DNA-binding NtrC family response regulator